MWDSKSFSKGEMLLALEVLEGWQINYLILVCKKTEPKNVKQLSQAVIAFRFKPKSNF